MHEWNIWVQLKRNSTLERTSHYVSIIEEYVLYDLLIQGRKDSEIYSVELHFPRNQNYYGYVA